MNLRDDGRHKLEQRFGDWVSTNDTLMTGQQLSIRSTIHIPTHTPVVPVAVVKVKVNVDLYSASS